ncbi:hypothetical protein VKT23_014412 [Stygiomarasmius scandens]|uniref:Heterokaryon incompatibility domain-containing protein n=1 Tax=Marasmiellus scandens TaxID=2682957 RepID=A0ABR1J0M3_9AGAR
MPENSSDCDVIFPCSSLSNGEFHRFFTSSPQAVCASEGDYISGHSQIRIGMLIFYPKSNSWMIPSNHCFRRRKQSWLRFLPISVCITNFPYTIHRLHSHRCFQVERGNLIPIRNPVSPKQLASLHICPRRFIETYTLKLVEFGKDTIVPPYAILSHRWIHGEEIVYEEFLQPRERTFRKFGYQKIEGACRQAREDGIRYIWVDTCCIEQGNHDDVAENIISMYAYYQNAEICYAYLVDAENRYDVAGWLWGEIILGGSEWFQRGWTLQELVAPRTVIFFNKRWEYIGDKHRLRYIIHYKTTIPSAVLSGKQSIQDIDVLDRMSWSTRRTTTKKTRSSLLSSRTLGDHN